ncbi:MAG: PAS domain S-box protein, partial [Gemmatimonadetes bacterium]|nr:PAS domain S-box protein [Gemmatimonadota bacterium]
MRRTLEESSLARFAIDPAAAGAPVADAGAAAPDIVVLDVRGTDGAADDRILSVRREYGVSALVVVGDAAGFWDASDSTVPGGAGSGAEIDCYLAGSDYHILDRAALAAAKRNRRMLDLQRRVHELETGERNLRMLVMTTSDGIMIVDMDGLICFANPAAEQLFGRPSDQLIGESFGFPLVSGDTTTIDLFRADGGPCVAELRATRTRWEGRPARLAALRDVTERIRAEQQERELVREHARRKAAEESERRTGLLSEATRLLSATLDDLQALEELAELVVPVLADCCIVDLVESDAEFQRVAVASHGDARPLAERLRSAQPKFLSATGPARALSTGEPWKTDQRSDPDLLAVLGLGDDDVSLPDGMRVMLLPLIAREEPVGAMMLIRFPDRGPIPEPDLLLTLEIAQRAAVAIDNARLYRSAQEAAQAKADFLAVMSHELRTPLNAVIGYAELLMMGVPAELPDESQEQVGRIRKSASHLLRLINEILTYSSLEDGRAELDIETTAVPALLEDIVSMLRPLAEAKGVNLVVELPDDEVALETDPAKLKQVLLNLVGNAIKFTDEGTVGLTVRTEAHDVVIAVHDTGCGIAEADIDRIFHPFWQAEQSRTRKAEGTGLGLALARRLTHLLAADLTVESILGDGSEFTLRLPWRYPRSRRQEAVEREG